MRRRSGSAVAKGTIGNGTEINNTLEGVKKRRIIIFCDGTKNDQIASKTPTNIALMHQYLEPEERDIVLYYKGIGVPESDHSAAQWFAFIDSVYAYTLDYKIKEIYNDLVTMYRPGTEIFLFGFSRGALVARSLSNFIRQYGVLKREERYIGSIDGLYAAYLQGNRHPVKDISNSYVAEVETVSVKSVKEEMISSATVSVAAAEPGSDDRVASDGVSNHEENIPFVQQVIGSEPTLESVAEAKEVSEIENNGMNVDAVPAVDADAEIDTKPSISRADIDRLCHPLKVKFMGLFDTVFGLDAETEECHDVGFYPDFHEEFCHILASDVTDIFINVPFYENFADSQKHYYCDEEKNRLEIVFAGDHCNIGGGWIENPTNEPVLSNTTLILMMHRCGLNFRRRIFPVYSTNNWREGVKSICKQEDMMSFSYWKRTFYETFAEVEPTKKLSTYFCDVDEQGQLSSFIAVEKGTYIPSVEIIPISPAAIETYTVASEEQQNQTVNDLPPVNERSTAGRELQDLSPEQLISALPEDFFDSPSFGRAALNASHHYAEQKQHPERQLDLLKSEDLNTAQGMMSLEQLMMKKKLLREVSEKRHKDGVIDPVSILNASSAVFPTNKLSTAEGKEQPATNATDATDTIAAPNEVSLIKENNGKRKHAPLPHFIRRPRKMVRQGSKTFDGQYHFE